MDIKERNEILQEHYKLIGKAASVFIQKENIGLKYEYEDMFNVGCIGVMKSLENYKPRENVKLSTYIYGCAKFEIMKYINRDKYFNKRNGEKYTPIELLSTDDVIPELGYKYIDIIRDDSCDWDKLVQEINFDLLCDMFTEKQKDILSLRFKRDMNKAAVSKRLGITKQYVGHLEKKTNKRITDSLMSKLDY